MEVSSQIEELFQKVIKKHNKLHLIGSSETMIGNSLCIGNPSYGKTSSNKREAEIRLSKGHKIFCLYDAGRMDLAYFMFPSVSLFWKKPKVEGNKIIGAKAYKTVLLYPVTKHIPKKIPNNAIPFTIGVKDLDENDFVALVGDSGRDTIKSALYYMENHINKETTPIDYLNMLGNALNRNRDRDKIKMSIWAAKKLKGDVLLPLINEGLLSSSSIETNINLRDMIKDRETIHVLVLKHCPQSLWGFLVHYFMNHLFKILSGIDNEKRVHQKTTIILNEMADLLDVNSEVGSSGEAVSTMISKIAKQSRTPHIFLVGDTQLPQQLPDVKDTMQRVYVFNSGISEVQKAMEIIGISTRTGEITGDDLLLIPRLPRGYYYLFDKTFGVSLHKLVWTRSRTYNEGEDFYDIYERVYGKASYTDINSILTKVKQEREKSEELWTLRDKEIREAMKKAKEEKERLEKERKLIEEEEKEQRKLNRKIQNAKIAANIRAKKSEKKTSLVTPKVEIKIDDTDIKIEEKENNKEEEEKPKIADIFKGTERKPIDWSIRKKLLDTYN